MWNLIANQSVINDLNERSTYLIQERVSKIPANYQEEKDRIVREMQKASPNAFHELYMKDYPGKNEKQVNKLAIGNITSDEVKHEIVREIKSEVNPSVEQKTANSNKIVRTATKKVVNLAIKRAVGAAVDGVKAQMERQFVAESNNDKTRVKY